MVELTLHMKPEQFAIMVNNMQGFVGLLGRGDLTINGGHPPLASNVEFTEALQTIAAHALSSTLGEQIGAGVQGAVFGMQHVDEHPTSQATAIAKTVIPGKGTEIT